MPRAARRQVFGTPRSPARLPTQTTSFVGREAELLELGGLARRSRLVTITGSAGLGKTRLAIEVAGRPDADAQAGAWFVGLAALHDGGLVAQEIAVALGLGERAGESLVSSLVGHIDDRPMLLVVDNC